MRLFRRAKEDYARWKVMPQKPPKPKLIEPKKPKPVIVKKYSGFLSNRTFEQEAAKLAEKGYFVQSVTALGQQITDIKTKTKGGTFGAPLGVRFTSEKSKGTVASTDGGLVVTYALSDEGKAEYLAAVEASKSQFDIDVASYPARLAEYEVRLAEWKASKPS